MNCVRLLEECLRRLIICPMLVYHIYSFSSHPFGSQFNALCCLYFFAPHCRRHALVPCSLLADIRSTYTHASHIWLWPFIIAHALHCIYHPERNHMWSGKHTSTHAYGYACMHACMKTHCTDTQRDIRTHARTHIQLHTNSRISLIIPLWLRSTYNSSLHSVYTCLLFVSACSSVFFSLLSRSETIILLRSFYDRPFTTTNPFFNISWTCVHCSCMCTWAHFIHLSIRSSLCICVLACSMCRNRKDYSIFELHTFSGKNAANKTKHSSSFRSISFA